MSPIFGEAPWLTVITILLVGELDAYTLHGFLRHVEGLLQRNVLVVGRTELERQELGGSGERRGWEWNLEEIKDLQKSDLEYDKKRWGMMAA